MNYYSNELKNCEPTDPYLKVKFSAMRGETKWMNLDQESIDAIREYLDQVEAAIKD